MEDWGDPNMAFSNPKQLLFYATMPNELDALHTLGAVLGDKACSIKASRKTLLRKECHDFTIKMNPMKAKNVMKTDG